MVTFPMQSFRTELQGLRAVAVILVLGFHLAPTVVRGGFVGVDVFFVLSGYLITRMLVTEAQRTGRVSIHRFLYRRARRLLPAAGVVLLTTAIATIALLPAIGWTRAMRHVAAATVQLENWLLVQESSDYLRLGAEGTATQHFWTLSTEWQVYLGWVVVIAIVARLSLRALPWVAGALILCSFVTAVWLTATDPALAYYATQSRFWEFALGGMVAMVPSLGAARGVVRIGLGWLGLVAIVASGMLLSSDVPFPGAPALLPTLGAGLVIATGAPAVLGWRPLVWLGDRSYAIYLWHWPILAFVIALRGQPGPLVAVAIALASVALAALTAVLVENPLRRTRRTSLVIPVIVVALLAPLAVAGGTQAQMTVRIAELDAGPAQGYPGAAAIGTRDAGRLSPLPVRPDPLIAFDDRGETGEDDACVRAEREPVACEFGDPGAARTLVVIGDSHAWQLVPLLDVLGSAEGWRVVSYTKSSCPFTPVTVAEGGRVLADCDAWRLAVLELLAQDPPELVVAAALTPWGYELVDFTAGTVEEQAAGYARYWAQLAQLGIPVVAVKDTPYMQVNVPECVAAGGSCDGDPAAVFHADSLVLAQAQSDTVGLIDLTAGICRESVCPAIVGNVLVYRDEHHLTATYARTLEPLFAEQLRALGY